MNCLSVKLSTRVLCLLCLVSDKGNATNQQEINLRAALCRDRLRALVHRAGSISLFTRTPGINLSVLYLPYGQICRGKGGLAEFFTPTFQSQ